MFQRIQFNVTIQIRLVAAIQRTPEIMDLGHGRVKNIRIICYGYKIFPIRCKQPEAILFDIGHL